MLKFEELCQLIRVVAEQKVSSVEIEQDGMRIRIDGPPAPLPAGTPLLGGSLAPVAFSPSAASAPGASTDGQGEGIGADEAGLVFVTSPIVGTFYRAPNPEAPPFVEVGAVVRKGQVLCIVEAMKLMNEIESDVSGVVVRAYAENAQPVEFGQRLFALRSA
ncbi:MAG TPA: acetyl-CoA carboxylase biotin carboxyl carrier protein [Thermoanaerobaculaceae bacterium]|nr:acetyl-CoA carboxylase biotin carboxyl carrier protein [Thermoanaerobaculaceae bacterium]HPS77174.1 acetyl-CoA carboxylase biotin carboxyl carrier protein [Thermoanaerobaculaceae bacterium]